MAEYPQISIQYNTIIRGQADLNSTCSNGLCPPLMHRSALILARKARAESIWRSCSCSRPLLSSTSTTRRSSPYTHHSLNRGYTEPPPIHYQAQLTLHTVSLEYLYTKIKVNPELILHLYYSMMTPTVKSLISISTSCLLHVLT